MRLLSILTVILLMFVALGIWVNHSLETAALKLSDNILQVSREVKKSNWEDANKHVAKLEENWDRLGNWWPIVLDHQEIDNIEFSIAKVKEYVEEKDRVQSLVQLSEIKLMIMHLPEKEALTLKNIL